MNITIYFQSTNFYITLCKYFISLHFITLGLYYTKTDKIKSRRLNKRIESWKRNITLLIQRGIKNSLKQLGWNFYENK